MLRAGVVVRLCKSKPRLWEPLSIDESVCYPLGRVDTELSAIGGVQQHGLETEGDTFSR